MRADDAKRPRTASEVAQYHVQPEGVKTCQRVTIRLLETTLIWSQLRTSGLADATSPASVPTRVMRIETASGHRHRRTQPMIKRQSSQNATQLRLRRARQRELPFSDSAARESRSSTKRRFTTESISRHLAGSPAPLQVVRSPVTFLVTTRPWSAVHCAAALDLLWGAVLREGCLLGALRMVRLRRMQDTEADVDFSETRRHQKDKHLAGAVEDMRRLGLIKPRDPSWCPVTLSLQRSARSGRQRVFVEASSGVSSRVLWIVGGRLPLRGHKGPGPVRASVPPVPGPRGGKGHTCRTPPRACSVINTTSQSVKCQAGT